MKALEILKTLREDHTYDHIVSYDASMKEVKEAISELEEAMKTKTCYGCKTLPFVLTELSKKNGGKCGTCKRYVKDNYQAEPKEQR